MFTPTIAALSKMYNARVDLYLDGSWKDSRRTAVEDLFRILPYSNEIIQFNGVGLDKEKYAAIYWTSHGERYECWQYFRQIATLKSMFPDEDDNWLQSKIHEIDFYIEPLYENGYRGIVQGQLQGLNFDKGTSTNRVLTIGLCNGFFGEASVNWSRKAWPHFEELVVLINEFFNKEVEIILLGKGSGECKWAKDIESIMESRGYMVKNLVDRLPVIATIRKVAKLDMLVSTDTGLMHIADALGVPLVVMFGSTLASKNGPYRKAKSRLVHSLEGCSPCQSTYRFHICDDFVCMKNIPPSDVFAQMLTLLGEQNYVFS